MSHKETMKNSVAKLITLVAVLISLLGLVSAAANFQVTAFSCTPSEAAVNEAFSCTAQVQNSGDATGTLGTATLYPDSGNWLENSNYPKTVNTQIGVGQSAEVTFIGLRATVSGSNGFQKITLDDATDTFVADENVNVNIINVVVAVNNSASSRAMGQAFDSTAEVTAGGSIDVTLTFSVSSGGCSIGSQSSQKTISGMTDGSKQSSTWTVTQGTSGSCQYTITASATGTGGVATKSDSTSSVVTCSDCPSSSSSSSSSGGGGGGGGVTKYDLGALVAAKTVELAKNEKAVFIINNENHSVRLINLTDTTAMLGVQSTEQTATLGVGETKEFDLDSDGKNDISVRLKSVNIIKKTVEITISPLESPLFSPGVTGEAIGEGGDGGEGGEGGIRGAGGISKAAIWPIVIIIGIIILIMVLISLGILGLKKKKEKTLQQKVKVYKDSIFSKAGSIIRAGKK